jgi:hypothetical protein
LCPDLLLIEAVEDKETVELIIVGGASTTVAVVEVEVVVVPPVEG